MQFSTDYWDLSTTYRFVLGGLRRPLWAVIPRSATICMRPPLTRLGGAPFGAVRHNVPAGTAAVIAPCSLSSAIVAP
jgi:hypothetical protein